MLSIKVGKAKPVADRVFAYYKDSLTYKERVPYMPGWLVIKSLRLAKEMVEHERGYGVPDGLGVCSECRDEQPHILYHSGTREPSFVCPPCWYEHYA
jgi:hypothetical protein